MFSSCAACAVPRVDGVGEGGTSGLVVGREVFVDVHQKGNNVVVSCTFLSLLYENRWLQEESAPVTGWALSFRPPTFYALRPKSTQAHAAHTPTSCFTTTLLQN